MLVSADTWHRLFSKKSIRKLFDFFACTSSGHEMAGARTIYRDWVDSWIMPGVCNRSEDSALNPFFFSIDKSSKWCPCLGTLTLRTNKKWNKREPPYHGPLNHHLKVVARK
jgi:hypothetical protein